LAYLVGTGGWIYFNVPGESSLKAYSKVLSFVEVNYTFYEYPDFMMVKQWRLSVPNDFVFAVRCHQDLTHNIGLRPTREAYGIFGKMLSYCDALRAPFLVLETPASYKLTSKTLEDARDFFSSLNLQKTKLVWEIRAPLTEDTIALMKDLNIIHCTDLSQEKPSSTSDIVYSRLFGKGRHNLYQFTDEELVDINQRAQQTGSKTVVLSYHGARMYSDATRFKQYQLTGKFIPATSFVGLESVKAVLDEDTQFPAFKEELIEAQGWKVVDISSNKRVHLSELLTNIPQKTYYGIGEVLAALEGYV
jgi:uncharacterized protein YecE (DUF72 family)